MSYFRPMTRAIDFLLPPSVQDWLPERHLARYVVEVVEGLDLSALERAYGGRGSAAYHPAMLLALLIYGYATGCFSSRKIERATYDSLAFRYIACNGQPDHDTLATFRRRFNPEFEAVFVSVLAGRPGKPTQPVRQRQSGRHQDPCQRQPPRRAVIWARRGHRSATEERGSATARLPWPRRPTVSTSPTG